MKTGEGLVDYAGHQLGQCYWWGCFGQVATKSLLDYKRKQYPSVYNTKLYLDAESQFGKRVFDCVGLIKGYLWSNTYDSEPKYNPAQDVNVAALYGSCTKYGLIRDGTTEMQKGICLFTKSLDHVGVYVGNGELIEAKGHADGVVKTKLRERFFYFWGMPSYISYENQDYIEPYYRLSEYNQKFIEKLPMLKVGDFSIAVLLMKHLLLRFNLNVQNMSYMFDSVTKEAVLEFQRKENLEVDGICGKNTWTALIEA